MAEWFEVFDEGLWLKGDEGAEAEARFIKRALHLRKGQTVLDAPCGDGRIAVELARAGCLVVGVDRDRAFIERAWQRFREEGLKGEFLVADLREIAFVECFHAAFNWFGSFGYFAEEENLEVLRRMARAVRPGGRVLLEQPSRENILRHFQRRRQRPGLVIENRWDARQERVFGRWTLERRGAKHTYDMSMRLYTAAQFRDLFRRAGLKVEALYDSSDGSKFTRTSRRLAVVGRKDRG